MYFTKIFFKRYLPGCGLGLNTFSEDETRFRLLLVHTSSTSSTQFLCTHCSQAVIYNHLLFKSLPNNKIWDQSNLKAFVENIWNVVQLMICVTDWVENIMGKKGKCWLPFPTMFSKGFFPRVVKSQDCVLKSKLLTTQSWLLTPQKEAFGNI